MPKLLYQGHASLRITSDSGFVIYVDPYAGAGYDVPADLILVTHEHFDHNKVDLVPKKPDTTIITEKDALAGGKYNTFSFGSIQIESVEANNKNHHPDECVGYIITVDAVTVYVAGDTSTTTQMSSFAARHLDYAFLPTDGVFNMDPQEASQCAELISARHNVPYHTFPGHLFSDSVATKWTAPNKLIIHPTEEINL